MLLRSTDVHGQVSVSVHGMPAQVHEDEDPE